MKTPKNFFWAYNMTYANIKKLFSKNSSAEVSAELLNNMLEGKPSGNLIYVVGDNTDACGAFITSILQKADILAGRARSCFELEARKLFSIGADFVSPQDMENFFGRTALPSLKNIQREALSCLFALDHFDKNNCEVIIFETTKDFFKNTLSKLNITPDIVIFTSIEEETLLKMTNTLSRGTKDAIYFSSRDNYDYISNRYSQTGTRLTAVSSNKINIVKTNSFGTNFYYNTLPYKIQAAEHENIIFAALSLECISALSRLGMSFSNYSLTKGLESADLLFDFKLFSLSPTVILKAGRLDMATIPSFLKERALTVIKEEDIPPSAFHKTVKSLVEQSSFDALLFSGSLSFLENIKKELEKILK